MGSRLRLIEPDVVFAGAQRCNDRAFLFRPNHRADNKQLALGCDPDSLDPKNDKHPVPSIINIIGSSIGRALEKYPIELHSFETNINHQHNLFSASIDQLDNVPSFFRTANSSIAVHTNKAWRRTGKVFSSPLSLKLQRDLSNYKIVHSKIAT